MLAWLGQTARAGGQSVPFCTGPTETAPPGWQPAAVERRYRSCLGRVRGATFERVDAAAEELLGSCTRRSSRVRSIPDVFVPFDEPGFGRCSACFGWPPCASLHGPTLDAAIGCLTFPSLVWLAAWLSCACLHAPTLEAAMRCLTFPV
jgi:hypothetical protein